MLYAAGAVGILRGKHRDWKCDRYSGGNHGIGGVSGTIFPDGKQDGNVERRKLVGLVR